MENNIVALKKQNNCDNNIGLISIAIAIMEKENFYQFFKNFGRPIILYYILAQVSLSFFQLKKNTEFLKSESVPITMIFKFLSFQRTVALTKLLYP